MPDLPILLAAAVTGLLGGGHCAAMCGGIATTLPMAAGVDPRVAALQIHAGRLAGYAAAGVAAGGLGHGILALVDSRALSVVLRLLAGLTMIVIALRTGGWLTRVRAVPSAGLAIHRWLRPLHRNVLPANTLLRRLGAGALWGWLPCGLSASVLTAAWLRTGALQGGLTMLAFGLGTLPLMLSLSWSGARIGQRLLQPRWRTTGAVFIALAGLATLLAPWLMAVPALQGALRALGCIHA